MATDSQDGASQSRRRGRAMPWLAAMMVAAACLALAGWQWQRGQRQAAADMQLAARAVHAPVMLDELPADTGAWIGRRVTLVGRVVSPPILLDNVTRNGQPGWRVHELLELADGRSVLVVRGFADRAARDALPAGAGRVDGRLAAWPGVRRVLDGPDHAGDVWQALPPAALAAAYRVRLAPLSLIADRTDPPLQPLDTMAGRGMTPDRHYAYALQWALLAIAALAVCAALVRHPERTRP
ncbi:SURF1 family protein [Microvirgula aerodenitrificans]|nr:SURF1 family protein [Microvirgula aerodenitrificans]